MDKTQTTSLGLKLAGIYTLAIALSALPSTFMLIASGDSLTYSNLSVGWAKGFVIIPLLLTLLAGLTLLALNRTITVLLVRPDTEQRDTESAERYQSLAYVLMGIFLIVTSAPDLIGNLVKLALLNGRDLPPLLRPELLGNVLVCALGVALIYARGKWSAVTRRLASTRPMKQG